MKIRLFFALFFLLPPSVYGATLSNEDYTIQTKDINLQKNISPTPISSTAAVETLPAPFTFSLSDNLLDFGEVSTTNPIERTTIINISKGQASGFSLFAIEDHEPSFATHVIPDTWCDIGTCTDTLASLWESILTYGFGYRLENEDGYKQFANQTKGEPAALITEATNVTVHYKVNVSATQEEGVYTNTIRYIAIPDF